MCKTYLACTITPLNIAKCEALAFRLSLTPSCSFSGGLIYRPPGSCTQFLEAAPDTLASLLIGKNALTVISDFNIHLDDHNDPSARRCLADLDALQLTQLVHSSMHEKSHILDPIFSNDPRLEVLAPMRMPWTDHSFIQFRLPKPHTVEHKKECLVVGRKWPIRAPEDWIIDLESSAPPDTKDLEEAHNNWITWINRSIDWNFKKPGPLMLKTRTDRPGSAQRWPLKRRDVKSLNEIVGKRTTQSSK